MPNSLGRSLARGLGLALVVLSCGPAPQPRSNVAQANPPEGGRAPRADPCVSRAGQPQPRPLARKYDGLARSARCQDEVLTLMDEVAAALGVGCDYCHERRDYQADTRRKQIATWMATEFSPRVAAKSHSGPVACPDCHARGAKPVAKLLGSPRTESHAIEWMTTELVENFTQTDGKPLRCRTCHGENLDSAEFRRRLVLTDALSELPKRASP